MGNRIFGFMIAGLMAMGMNLWAAQGQVGTTAYDWAGYKDLKGKTYNLKDFRGKVTLLFVLEYSCGGCKANAGRVGQIAAKYQNKAFQAVGVELGRESYTALVPKDSIFSDSLKSRSRTVDFPILIGIPDSQITLQNNQTAPAGKKWNNFDSYRDVFFVIDTEGKIIARIDGNRGNTMGESNYTALDTAIAKAVNAVPTSLKSVRNVSNGLVLTATKSQGGFSIRALGENTFSATRYSLNIYDSQGRLLRQLPWNAAMSQDKYASAHWDGKDSQGASLPWGTYFLSAGLPQGRVATLLLSWIP